MKKTPHIIWGRSSLTHDKFKLLKRNGMKEIYVLDDNQTKKVMEENDMVYLSRESFSLLVQKSPETFHHFFMYIPPKPKRKK